MSQSSRQRCGQHVTQYVAFLSTKHVVISFDLPVSHFFLYFHVQTRPRTRLGLRLVAAVAHLEMNTT